MANVARSLSSHQINSTLKFGGGVILAFILQLSFPASSQNISPGLQLRPIRPTPTNIFASAQNNQSVSAKDPRLIRLKQMLQAHRTTVHVTNSALLQIPVGFTTAKSTNGMSIDDDLEIRRRDDGSVAQIKRKSKAFSSAAKAGLVKNSARQTAREFVTKHKLLLQNDNPDQELTETGETVDSLGRRHIRLAQKFKGIPVWPSELSVHLSPDGGVDSLETTLVATPRGLDATPTLSSEQAVEKARNALFAGENATSGKAELIVYAPLRKAPRLSWKFDLSSNLIDGRRCVVDAQTGDILSAVSLVHDGAVVGSGVDALGAVRSLNLWQNGATYYMADTSKPMFATGSLPPSPQTTRGEILIYDSRNTPATSDPETFGNPIYSASINANGGWTPDAISAAYGLSQVYDYYSLRHGRNSFDGNGASLIAYVRVGVDFPNAYWNAQLDIMVFGDGYSRSLDVCGHEVTHAVISSVGDGGVLDYEGQSGALNESYADIFGEMVEARAKGTNDWLIGSQLGIGPIRNMANPNAYGQPGTMSQYVNTSSDNGGVHENSGIINHAYYLLAAGLSGAIGNSDAERIFYRALTLHLQKQSEFIDARHACITSAEELFGVGSVQARRTEEAFDAVEIFDGPPSPTPSAIPTVQAPDSTLALRWDALYQTYYLVRREAARGDGSNGNFVYTEHNLASCRVSVSGDGSEALFVTEDHDLGILETDGSDVQLLGFPDTIHSVALSPDSHYAAVILLDSFGNPKDQIEILDLEGDNNRTLDLYSVNSEGQELALIDHADVMDFTADGRYLVYDALCYAVTSEGDVFDGWAIFAVDILTGQIQTLTDPNTEYNVGNPALGNTRNNLVTFDVFDNSSGVSTVYAGDIFSGKISRIETVYGMGVPGYTGDDSAIVYSRYDATVDTTFTLTRQPVASDGLTKAGSPTTWLKDADYGVIYRRGTFAGSNAIPVVSFSNPFSGQTFTNPPSLLLQVDATDSDGIISRVEFYQGSTKLGQDSTSPYTFNWRTPSVGSHRLTARAVDNLGGTRDSQIQIFVQPSPDSQQPMASIAVPTSGLRTTNSTITISGSANDNIGVAAVEYRLENAKGTSEYQTASGTIDWSAVISELTPGTNTIRVRARDTSDNISSDVTRSFVYVQTSLFVMTVSGVGTVSPNQNGQNLEIGTSYTVKASPASGHLFSNWTGSVTSSTPLLTFVMQSNMLLQANFIPDPFIPSAGSYSGLFFENRGVDHQSSGYFTAKTTSKGAYTGKIQIAGKSYSLRGAFDFGGKATNSIVRKGYSPLVIDLQMDFSGKDQITGHITDGLWSADLLADKAIFNSKTNPAPLAGKYTMLFPRSSNSEGEPGGDGFGTVAVDASGKVSFRGTLGDGTRATQTSYVSKSGQWPLYIPLYRGAGSALSWVTFTNNTPKLFGGDLSWIKWPVLSPTFYIAGFTNETILLGSAYAPPLKGNRVLDFETGQVSFERGNLSQDFTNSVLLATNNKVTNLNSNKLTFTVTLPTGLFKGSATDPFSGKRISFQGALLQGTNLNYGAGFFLGTNQTGRVKFQVADKR